MKEFILKTREFNEMFMQIPSTQNPIELIYLRTQLLKEEISELKTAVINDDKKEIIDALCDIQYLLNGTIDLLGFTEQFETAFKEVHRTNMTKFLSSLNDVQRTIEDYTNAGVKCHYTEKNGKYAIIREDGKLIKPIGWEKPKL